MQKYLNLLEEVLTEGTVKGDRTGTGTISLDGVHAKYSLKHHTLPLVTTKKVHYPAIIHELLWFIAGDTNTKYLTDNNVRIWNEWADDNGDLGPVYGAQWRNWDNVGIDQIKNAITELKENPDSRRIVVSAWNPNVLPDPNIPPKDNVKFGLQALPPCHTMFQFTTLKMDEEERVEFLEETRPLAASGYYEILNSTDGTMHKHRVLDNLGAPTHKLSCHLYQRSGDMFLGVPFNIASYSILTMMVAQCVGMAPGNFSHYIADAHIYYNHLEQVREQLTREPYALPYLKLNPAIENLEDFKYEDIQVLDYDHHPAIKGKVAV